MMENDALGLTGSAEGSELLQKFWLMLNVVGIVSLCYLCD